MANRSAIESLRSQTAVLRFIASRAEGVTDAEVGEALGIKEPTVRDRRRRLHLQGLVRPVSTRSSDRAGAKIKATVWMAVEQ
jgi:predicted ArsR family transcriptional regulator